MVGPVRQSSSFMEWAYPDRYVRQYAREAVIKALKGDEAGCKKALAKVERRQKRLREISHAL